MRQQDLLLEQLQDTRNWTSKLIADLKGDDWYFQPAAGMSHALFLCGHLAVAQDLLIHMRCLSRAVVDDGFKKHFAVGAPAKSAIEHNFPSVETVLDVMRSTHEATCSAVRNMPDSLLAEPAFAGDGKSAHPHYQDKRGAVSHCIRHEAFHAGQIATIRRLLGREFLR